MRKVYFVIGLSLALAACDNGDSDRFDSTNYVVNEDRVNECNQADLKPGEVCP